MSLRKRVILTITALILVSMGVLSLFLLSFISNSYLDTYKENFSQEIIVFTEQSAAFVKDETQHNTSLSNLIDQFSTSLDLRATVILPDGKVIGESNLDPSTMENHFNRPEVQGALDGEITSNIRFSNTLQTEMLYVAAPIEENEEIIGIARFAISLEQVNANLQVMRITILGASILTTLVGILLGSIITNYTISPLSELTQKIQDFESESQVEIVPSDRQDEIGQLDRAFSSMAITLRNQVQTLQAEQGKLNAVLNNMSDGILIVNDNGTVELINPAAQNLLNINEKQALNSSVIEVVRNHKIIEAWERYKKTGNPQTDIFETSPERLYLQGSIIGLHSGLPGRCLIALNDVTHIRKLEIVRRDFVSNVSHELRTPLASLKSLSETLMHGALDDPPAAKKFLLLMEEEIDNLTQMVQELLELSRIESGRVPLKRKPVAPYDLLIRPVERMKFQAERSGINLLLNCEEDLPQVFADKVRISQVLINLIHNAIKFTKNGGTITVSARYENHKVVFSVQDTGVGITRQNLKRIFERFYKEDRARSGGGTGLGLSISKHLINQHGGEIWADSSLDSGSTFYFSLPEA